jgi:signal peptidase
VIPSYDTEPRLAPQPPAPSSAELELLRQHSIRALGSVAVALEAAAHQRQSLLAEVETAQQALQKLIDEREMAEASLAATRTQLNTAETERDLAQVERIGILSAVEKYQSDNLASRAALHDEVATLERRRAELDRMVSESHVAGSVLLNADISEPDAIPAPQPNAVTPRPNWPDVSLAIRARFKDVRGTRPTHPGLGSSVSGLLSVQEQRPAVARAARARIKGLLRARPASPGFSQLATGLLIALLLGLALLLTPLTQVFGGLQLLAVMSGSMEPTIPVGGVVAIRPVSASELKVGDAITFVNLSNPDVLVTHRIVSLELRDGQTMLTTKGDANDSVDALSAPASRAVGRVEFALPWLGYLMVWLGSPIARIAIVGLAVLGVCLTSVQRSSGPSTPAPAPAVAETYTDYEREIHSLLG